MCASKTPSFRFVLPKWLQHSNRPISTIDIHPSGEFFATGGWDNFCKIWNFKAIKNNQDNIPNKLLAVLRDHTKPINAVRFSPDGKYLATSGDDGMIFLWQKVRCFGQPSTFGIPDHVLRPNKPVQRWQSKPFVGHVGDVTGVCWYQDSSKIASSSMDGNLFIWDIKTCTRLFQINMNFGIKSVAVDPLGKFVAAQLMNGKLAVCDPLTSFSAQFAADFVGPEQALVSKICWTPDGSFVSLTSSNSGGFVTPFFKRETFQFGFMLEGHVAPTSALSCPSFFYRSKEDGSYSTMMACGDKSGVISIWMIGNETKPICVLDGVSSSTINDMCWSKDGKWLLVALESSPVTKQGGIVCFDMSNAITNYEPVDDETMDEIKSHLVGENSFRMRAVQSNKASELLKSIETEEKDVDLEILQLSTNEVLERQVTKEVDGITYITPVLLTAVEKQLISFRTTVESEPIPHLPSEFKPLGNKWEKPSILQGPVDCTIELDNFFVVSYSGFVIKLEKSTGRRLSIPFYIGGTCKHLSYSDGTILAVGDKCYLINIEDMKEIMSCCYPSGFSGFALSPHNIITAHMKGRTWIFDDSFAHWRGGAVSNESSDLSMEEIELLTKEESSVQWNELAQAAIFGCYTGVNEIPERIINQLEKHNDQESSNAYINSLKKTIAKHWPECGINV